VAAQIRAAAEPAAPTGANFDSPLVTALVQAVYGAARTLRRWIIFDERIFTTNSGRKARCNHKYLPVLVLKNAKWMRFNLRCETRSRLDFLGIKGLQERRQHVKDGSMSIRLAFFRGNQLPAKLN